MQNEVLVSRVSRTNLIHVYIWSPFAARKQRIFDLVPIYIITLWALRQAPKVNPADERSRGMEIKGTAPFLPLGAVLFRLRDP